MSPLRRLWNGLRWGSAEGPEIIIEAVNGKVRVIFTRMSTREIKRMYRRMTIR